MQALKTEITCGGKYEEILNIFQKILSRTNIFFCVWKICSERKKEKSRQNRHQKKYISANKKTRFLFIKYTKFKYFHILLNTINMITSLAQCLDHRLYLYQYIFSTGLTILTLFFKMCAKFMSKTNDKNICDMYLILVILLQKLTMRYKYI